MVPAEGGRCIISGGGSTALSALSGAAVEIPGAGAKVGSGTGASVPGAGAKMGQLDAECCHLVGEVLNPLHKCVFVGEWCDARECRLWCGLNDAVCTAASGVQVALVLASEYGP
jgi:hypothetical protein